MTPKRIVLAVVAVVVVAAIALGAVWATNAHNQREATKRANDRTENANHAIARYNDLNRELNSAVDDVNDGDDAKAKKDVAAASATLTQLSKAGDDLDAAGKKSVQTVATDGRAVVGTLQSLLETSTDDVDAYNGLIDKLNTEMTTLSTAGDKFATAMRSYQ